MNPDTREFLDTVACIAEANLNYLYDQEASELSLDDEGSQALMGAYLELYDQYTGSEQRSPAPSALAYAAAEACCAMRRGMEQRPKHLWDDEEHGLFTLMLAYMFMFKQLYVVRA